ncbi:uncharacterized protein PFL1_03485 [Pseudozyma flocculosa PF-1]|uniref:FAD-binding FR-type domain-containing protein n=1 Tax=Pseudozyma flocculosa PF-1 TaxID=1277687 RepID=A0A061H986_9BASI|nr:uncharacterized protein PFL1_03485 [Pseudozyma flocculosa PF-1]EPQ29198.1 hypothetical protein PFL1_03485 [Pseudozyma flocculosa PF-1]
MKATATRAVCAAVANVAATRPAVASSSSSAFASGSLSHLPNPAWPRYARGARRLYSAQPTPPPQPDTFASTPPHHSLPLSSSDPSGTARPTIDPSSDPGSSPQDKGSGGGGSSGGQGRAIVYILATTATIGALNYFFLSSPPSSSSDAARAKLHLEPRRYNSLPLVSTQFYPTPTETASEHKHLQILLPLSPAPPSPSADRRNVEDGDDVMDRLRIRSVYIKEPALQIERAYTPLYDTLPGSHVGAGPHLDLIIKRYPDGELGRYAHRLAPGHQVEVRGPVDTWSYAAHHAATATATTEPISPPEEIVMLVGGTGITPAYQLITSLLGRPSSSSSPNGPTGDAGAAARRPKLTLLYATSSLRSALLLPQLHNLVLAHPDRLRVAVFADSLETSQAASASASARSRQ